MTATGLEELADKADSAIAALTTRRTFEEARAALNEAGMRTARDRLDRALVRIGEAQTGVRVRADVASIARVAADQALAEAEWELDGRFETVGNKTFLLTPVERINEDDDGLDRKAMTADERAKWKQIEARKNQAVRDAAAQLRHEEARLSEAKDELVLAEKAFGAARADLEAAIATVGILAASIKGANQ